MAKPPDKPSALSEYGNYEKTINKRPKVSLKSSKKSSISLPQLDSKNQPKFTEASVNPSPFRVEFPHKRKRLAAWNRRSPSPWNSIFQATNESSKTNGLGKPCPSPWSFLWKIVICNRKDVRKQGFQWFSRSTKTDPRWCNFPQGQGSHFDQEVSDSQIDTLGQNSKIQQSSGCSNIVDIPISRKIHPCKF